LPEDVEAAQQPAIQDKALFIESKHTLIKQLDKEAKC
jgi:hypothetical protein